ncbi:hypothetical protein V6N13_050051 [Hibiscus sabdariffa]
MLKAWTTSEKPRVNKTLEISERVLCVLPMDSQTCEKRQANWMASSKNIIKLLETVSSQLNKIESMLAVNNERMLQLQTDLKDLFVKSLMEYVGKSSGEIKTIMLRKTVIQTLLGIASYLWGMDDFWEAIGLGSATESAVNGNGKGAGASANGNGNGNGKGKAPGAGPDGNGKGGPDGNGKAAAADAEAKANGDAADAEAKAKGDAAAAEAKAKGDAAAAGANL